MTIPYLPGLGDSLAQSLPQLGSGIAHIVNPQMDQQMALKAAIMKDPSILRQYASIERDNPGTLKSLGFGDNFSNAIGSIQPTAEEAARSKESEATNAALSTPEGKRAYGHKAAYGETESETASRTAEADLATSQKKAVDLNARVTQDNLNKLDIQNKRLENAIKIHPMLANKDVSQLASDVYNGKPVDPTLITIVNSDPNLKSVFDDYQKGMVERAKLAIEQGKLDEMKKSNKGQQAVAVNESLRFQKEAEKRVQQLQLLTTKYGGMGKDQFGLAETMAKERAATGDTGLLDEINAFKSMQGNNYQDLKDAQKDAKRYRATTLELMKANPEIKAAIDKLDAEDAKSESSTSKTDDKILSDPIVQQAIEYKNARGMKNLEQRDLWKSLNPKQQAAVKFSSDTLPDRAGSDQKVKPKRDTSGDTIPDRAGPNQILKQKKQPSNAYEQMLRDLQDTVNGRPVSSGRLPITSPNFDTPISGVDSGQLARAGFTPQMRP